QSHKACVDPAPPAARPVQRADEEKDSGRDHRHALENAERTRLEVLAVLKVERERHPGDAAEKAERVELAKRQAIHGSRILQSAAMTKAIRIERTGGPEVLQWTDVEVGAPAAGE